MFEGEEDAKKALSNAEKLQLSGRRLSARFAVDKSHRTIFEDVKGESRSSETRDGGTLLTSCS